MPGKRNINSADYMTSWKRVRANIEQADEAGPESEDIPFFGTQGGPGSEITDTNHYGRNAQIDFCVIMKGQVSITLELWLLVEEAQNEVKIQQPPTKMWILVDAREFSKSGFWVIKDIPPGKFKVRVSEASGLTPASSSSSAEPENFVTVLECHAA